MICSSFHLLLIQTQPTVLFLLVIIYDLNTSFNLRFCGYRRFQTLLRHSRIDIKAKNQRIKDGNSL